MRRRFNESKTMRLCPRPSMPWHLAGIIVGVIGLSDVACGPGGHSYRAGIQSERPTDRIRAIYKAGESKDPLAVALLVDRLEDEDEGVRLYAFLALERITGKRFDYDYAAMPSSRALAVDRWRAYVRERYAAGTSPLGRSDIDTDGAKLLSP